MFLLIFIVKKKEWKWNDVLKINIKFVFFFDWMVIWWLFLLYFSNCFFIDLEKRVKCLEGKNYIL